MTTPTLPAPTRQLTPRQQRFVAEYIIDLNASQAAIRAGYSPKTAYSIGSELLNKPEIASAIEAAKTKALEALGYTANRVLQELVSVALSDLTKVLDWDETNVTFRNSDELPPHVRAAISGVKVKRKRLVTGSREYPEEWEIEEREVSLHPKVPALSLLMKHLGLLPKDGPDLKTLMDLAALMDMARSHRAKLAGEG